MVKQPLICKSHLGFTMIELIFAIVIIGITVVSLPMMTQATSKSIENSFVQEAIFAASVEVMESLSYRWDRNSAENNTSGENSCVLDIAKDCENDTSSVRYAKRPGHIARSCYTNLNDPRADTAANSSHATIENLNNAATTGATNIFTGVDSSGYGYKKAYTKATTVAITGFGPSNVGNIKQIETTVTDPNDSNIKVVLKAYSANIGEVEYLKRSF